MAEAPHQTKHKGGNPFIEQIQHSNYKLLSNSCYGKTLESKWYRVNVKSDWTWKAVLEYCDRGSMKSINILDENLVAIESRKKQYYWDVPTLLGSCSIGLAKFIKQKLHDQVSNSSPNLGTATTLKSKKQKIQCIFNLYFWIDVQKLP